MTVEYKLTCSEAIESSRIRSRLFLRTRPREAYWTYGIAGVLLVGLIGLDIVWHIHKWRSHGIVTPGPDQYLEFMPLILGLLGGLVSTSVFTFGFLGPSRVEIETTYLHMTLATIGRKPVS